MDDDYEEILDHWLHRDIFVPEDVGIITCMQNGGPEIFHFEKQITYKDSHIKLPPSEIDEGPDSKRSSYSDMKTQEEQTEIEIVRHEEFHNLTEN